MRFWFPNLTEEFFYIFIFFSFLFRINKKSKIKLFTSVIDNINKFYLFAYARSSWFCVLLTFLLMYVPCVYVFVYLP